MVTPWSIPESLIHFHSGDNKAITEVQNESSHESVDRVKLAPTGGHKIWQTMRPSA